MVVIDYRCDRFDWNTVVIRLRSYPGPAPALAPTASYSRSELATTFESLRASKRRPLRAFRSSPRLSDATRELATTFGGHYEPVTTLSSACELATRPRTRTRTRTRPLTVVIRLRS